MYQELSEFLDYCRLERRLAPLTCSAYERDVRACLAFLERAGIGSLEEVRPADLRRFLTAEAKRRPAPSSRTRTIAALKGFFRFLLENEEIERDPAQVLRTPKKREALPDVLDRRELARLLAATEREDVWERHFPGRRERDRLMLALFAYAGLRRSELLGLDWDDVDLERRLLHVRKAKGGRQRAVPIHPALEPLFTDYLSVRARDPERALFVGVHGRRLSGTIMTQTFLRYARAAGVTERKRVTPHTLRHVFASELLRAGANLRQIQELLGHKHLDSRWLSERAGVPNPFRDLEVPGRPRQEADWLTPDEFRRLLEAAGSPRRRQRGLAERDRLVLLTLVATGLRRSELIALNWRDVDLGAERPSVLVRRGKGGKPRRQPLPTPLARELQKLHATRRPESDAPIFCGLQGKRLHPGMLGLIVRRAAERAELDKRVTAHTLRHTAATWLRQRTGDARLVAAYLGHADLSTVSRYAHVADDELHDAASAIAASAGLDGALKRAV